MRRVGAAPSLASASVSLNTSVLHFGQAVGSAIGGFLYVRDLLYAAVMWRRRITIRSSHVGALRDLPPKLVRNSRQHGLEGDARHLQRRAFKVDHVAVVRALQRERDHVRAEQRFECRIGVVALRCDLDVNAVVSRGVVADEREGGVAAPEVCR
jgi:hypothetical protein